MDKDKIIDFTKHLNTHKSAQRYSEKMESYIAEAVLEEQCKMVAETQRSLSIDAKAKLGDSRHESFFNRALFTLINKRYPGLTTSMRREQRDFFAKQFKAMFAVLFLMIIWFELLVPKLFEDMDPLFNDYFVGGAGIVMYMMLGAVIFRISTRQGLLDLLQMHSVLKKS